MNAGRPAAGGTGAGLTGAAMAGLILAIAAFLLSFFHRVAPAALAADLQVSFAIGGTQLGMLAATYFYVYTVMQVPTGVMVDTLGPRRILFWGGLVAGLGAIVFGLASSFEMAFAGRTLIGLGVSGAFIAMLKLIAIGFDERRFATITGICVLIGNLGSVLAGAPLAWAAQWVGWRQVILVVGVMSIMLAVASRIWVPESRAAAKIDPQAWRAGMMTVLKNRATWPGFFSNLGLAGAMFSFAGLWAVPYLTQMHAMTRTVASNHVSIYFLGFAFGAAVWGRVSDSLGKRRFVALTASGVHVLCWLIWLGLGSLPLATTYVLCAVMGFASAGFTLSWTCAKEVNPPQLSGMATSVVNVGAFLGAALLQPLTGWIMERTWDGRLENGVRLYSSAEWHNGMLLLATAAIGGWIATWFVRETGCRNIYQAPKNPEGAMQ